MKKIIVAIDGHSSCGKSTMAKSLAAQVGYIYVDTGAMYRAVTLFAMRQGLFDAQGQPDAARLEALVPKIEVSFRLDPDTHLPLVCLNGEVVEEEVRTLEVSSHVSAIAALPFVREALTRQQQRMGEEKGIVMDGRDIGTVVFPQAELKVFVTASAEVRAQRRCLELEQRGMPKPYDEVLRELNERDYNDSHRAAAPLRAAEDAIVVDTSALDFDASREALLALIRERLQ